MQLSPRQLFHRRDTEFTEEKHTEGWVLRVSDF
jgi:hypothetical protein